MDPVSIGLAIASIFGGLFGGKKDTPETGTSATNDPAIANMLASQQARMRLQDPLYEAVTRLAMGLMPKQYQGAIGSIDYTGGGRIGNTGQTPGSNPIGTPGLNYTGPFPPGSRKSDDNRNWTSPDELREQRRTREYRGGTDQWPD